MLSPVPIRRRLSPSLSIQKITASLPPTLIGQTEHYLLISLTSK